MLKRPTPNEVLIALSETRWPRTVFIAMKFYHMTPRPKSALVLRRLRDLERAGYIVTDGYPNGYYGFEWSITASGHAFLSVLLQERAAA